MNSKERKTLSTFARNYTQKSAIYTALDLGISPSVSDMKAAGIADPKRVIHSLRSEHGLKIKTNRETDRKGNVTSRYAMA